MQFRINEEKIEWNGSIDDGNSTQYIFSQLDEYVSFNIQTNIILRLIVLYLKGAKIIQNNTLNAWLTILHSLTHARAFHSIRSISWMILYNIIIRICNGVENPSVNDGERVG